LEDVLLSDFLEPEEPEEPESEDFDEEPPSELELLFESDEVDDEDPESLLLELSLASFISRERLRVP
jgi:hypothetical protein